MPSSSRVPKRTISQRQWTVASGASVGNRNHEVVACQAERGFGGSRIVGLAHAGRATRRNVILRRQLVLARCSIRLSKNRRVPSSTKQTWHPLSPREKRTRYVFFTLRTKSYLDRLTTVS